MKAVILAAGVGSRIADTAEGLPKPLLPVSGTPILGRIFTDLRNVGITEVLVTTGYGADQIIEYTKGDAGHDLSISFVNNPKFADTNYIYSLWLARDDLHDDVLLFHGDMVYEASLLQQLLAAPKSAALVQREGELPQKDFKARIQHDRITGIGVNVFGEGAHACMPIYRLLKQDVARWMEKIDQYVQRGDVNSYAEDALNELLDEIYLAPAYYQDELCMEVDT
ncbi:MAG TPA: phosphocholine cytidylyltransferase family protein, partial [Candidatus Peribacteraceae bacterium]|nr:phosphocholine cytidylyltransferase family protein [Candidatus Peribacteraceae bacterium]